MTWAAPAALALAAALLLPLVAHLWSRRQPTAVPFPTLRFLRAASPVSRRLRHLHDWPLWLLRSLIVLVIVAAAAGPTWDSVARRETRAAQLTRFLVVPPASTERAQTAARALPGVADTRLWQTNDIAAQLPVVARVARETARTGRTEIAIAWDGSRATLSPLDLKVIPDGIGVRLLVLDEGVAPSRPVALANPPLEITATENDRASRDAQLALLRARHLPTSPGRIRLYWPGTTATPVASQGSEDPRVRRAIAAMRDDARLREAAQRSPILPDGTVAGVPPQADVVARGIDGRPALHAWADSDALAVALHASPSSPLGWWSLVSAIEASAAPARWVGATADGRWAPEDLTGAMRDAATPADLPLPGGLDTRWAWLAALTLLLVEQWWRRGRRDERADADARTESRADAA